VEGAVKGIPWATNDGHSIDDTVDILQNSDRFDDKLTVVWPNNRRWESKQEQQNQFFKHMNHGDVFMNVGVDEFILYKHLKQIKHIMKTKNYNQIIMPLINHWKTKDYIQADLQGNPWGLRRHERIVRYEDGMHYCNHPTVHNKNHVDTFFSSGMAPKRFFANDMWVLHYNYCRPMEYIMRKNVYYRIRDELEHGPVHITDRKEKGITVTEQAVNGLRYKDDCKIRGSPYVYLYGGKIIQGGTVVKNNYFPLPNVLKDNPHINKPFVNVENIDKVDKILNDLSTMDFSGVQR
jgi:hypothetical protein